MKELTKAEEQVMQILWRLNKGFVRDILNELPDPKPAYNTISTIVRILEKKGFVDHNAFGKNFQYYPVVGKKKYQSFYLQNFVGEYFGGSFESLVSFFAKDKKMDLKELDHLMKNVKEELEENPTKRKEDEND